MPRLKVCLFGKLSVQRDEREVDDLNPARAQELFSYLLLHRARFHPRETLAGLLWGDIPTVQSKKYLRQALWQLQTALNDPAIACEKALRIEPDWVGMNPEADLWLDVAVFERACMMARELTCSQMNAAHARALRSAAELYRGDLLEGWYQDWCLYERERLLNLHLGLLDKLMSYSEVRREYEAGRAYGMQILRSDRTRESTHQQLMRLHFLAGDRAAALRQYERCASALDEDLGVKPSEVTVALYHRIKAGQLGALSPAASMVAAPAASSARSLAGLLGRLRQLEVTFAGIHRQLQTDIRMVETTLSRQAGPKATERRAPVRSVPASGDPARRQKPAARG